MYIKIKRKRNRKIQVNLIVLVALLLNKCLNLALMRLKGIYIVRKMIYDIERLL